jgi:hypothetical protein
MAAACFILVCGKILKVNEVELAQKIVKAFSEKYRFELLGPMMKDIKKRRFSKDGCKVEMLSHLASHPDPYSLAIFLEPYLPLIKSRALYQLYRELRYHTGEYASAIEALEREAQVDYRLEKVLEKLKMKVENC